MIYGHSAQAVKWVTYYYKQGRPMPTPMESGAVDGKKQKELS